MNEVLSMNQHQPEVFLLRKQFQAKSEQKFIVLAAFKKLESRKEGTKNFVRTLEGSRGYFGYSLSNA